MENTMSFSNAALRIFEKRLYSRAKDGVLLENSPKQLFWRVAKVVATGESVAERSSYEKKYFDLMSSKDFLPNSPTLMNAGNEGTLSACFTGDTIIATTAGDFTVLELLQKNVNTFDVYSCSEDNKLQIGKAHSLRLTHENAPVYKIVLDTGQFIKLTEEHLLMLRDATYRSVKNLKIGDSIMPFNTDARNGYRAIFAGIDKYPIMAHKFVYKKIIKKDIPSTHVLHHKNYNKQDNSIENLQEMDKIEHFLWHSKHLHEFNPMYNEETRRKISLSQRGNRSAKGSVRSLEFRRALSEHNGMKRKDVALRSVATHRSRNSYAKTKEQKQFLSDQWRNKTWEQMFGFERAQQMHQNRQLRDLKLHKIKVCLHCKKQFDVVLSHNYRKYCSQECFINRNVPYNHVVISIEFAGYENVYDISVDKWNNFAANGIFIHNCFVLPLEDTIIGIMDCAKNAALVQKYGGGTGFSLSNIRPKGAPISTTHGKACGPIAVLRHLSSVSKLVTQGGKRDGANMAVLNVHHPDILEFIDCKLEEGDIHNFNISVGATDEFMTAVLDDTNYNLYDPITKVVTRQYRATDVWNKIAQNAHRNGEPGMVWLDTINRNNPMAAIERIDATNPCGEQPLSGFESCNLGSINLANFYVATTNNIDWKRLGGVVRLAVRFLDNIIDINKYAIPEIENATKRVRKIGLGVMGFADLLTKLNISYASNAGIEIASTLMSFISQIADDESCRLGATRGVFPAWEQSIYKDMPNQPTFRNACRLSIAPTGTLAMLIDCSYGIEPLFALVFKKQNVLEGESFDFVNKEFEQIAKQMNCYNTELIDWLSHGNSLQDYPSVLDELKNRFPTALDISPEWHVKMQGVFQQYVDAGVSKTINLRNDATISDVSAIYHLAYQLKCKGITVYRTHSREKEVLSIGDDQSAIGEYTSVNTPEERPTTLFGTTERLRTGHGNIYVTITHNAVGKPFEVFAALGKAGECNTAYLEAISRLTSIALRCNVPITEIVKHLDGITCHPRWDDGNSILSPVDAVAKALIHYANNRNENGVEMLKQEKKPVRAVMYATTEFESRCPICTNLLTRAEGCLLCIHCGYSKC